VVLSVVVGVSLPVHLLSVSSEVEEEEGVQVFVVLLLPPLLLPLLVVVVVDALVFVVEVVFPLLEVVLA